MHSLLSEALSSLIYVKFAFICMFLSSGGGQWGFFKCIYTYTQLSFAIFTSSPGIMRGCAKTSDTKDEALHVSHLADIARGT